MFINWSNYRSDFEREASRIVGREVKVNGQATARLLPFPSVTFSDVRIAGDPGKAPVVTVDQFSMDAELAPFLRGEILIFDMRVEKPVINLDLAENGALDLAIRPHTPAGVSEITLEKVQVTNGKIVINHGASGRTLKIDQLNGVFSAETLSGPWRATGTANANGRTGEFSLSSGTVNDDGSARLRMQIEPADFQLAIEADGNVYLEDAVPRYSGRFSVLPLDEGATQEAHAQKEPFSITVSNRDVWSDLRLTGEFSLDHKLLAFDSIQFASGPLDDPYEAEGTGFIDLGKDPRFAMKLEGRQVQLASRDDAGEPVDLDARLAGFTTFLNNLPQPGIPGTLEMSLPALVAGDTTIRDLDFSASPKDSGWDIARFSAKLPGRTTLEASGYLERGSRLGFNGSLLLAIAQPSGFAAWLSQDVDDAIRGLGAAGFSAQVSLSEERQSFRDLEMVLGTSSFRGHVDRVAAAGQSPATIIELDGGALDLGGLRALASIFLGKGGKERLSGDAFDVKLHAGPVAASGFSADNLNLAFRLKNSQLEMDELEVSGLAGANLQGTASFSGFPALSAGQADFSVTGADLKGLVFQLAERFPDIVVLDGIVQRIKAYPELFLDTRLAFKSLLDPEGLTMTGHGQSGGTQLDVRLRADRRWLAGDQTIDLSVTGINETGEAILAAWGLPVLSIGLAGRIESGFQLKGNAASSYALSASMSGPTALARFTGEVSGYEDRLNVTGTGEIKGEDVAPWLLATGYGFAGLELGLPIVMQTPVTYSGDVIGLPELTGMISGVALQGALDVNMKDERLKLTGQLLPERFSLDWIVANLLGNDAMTALETSSRSGTSFPSSAAMPFDMEIGVTSETVSLSGLPDVRDGRFRIDLEKEKVRLFDFEGHAAGGIVTGLAEIANNGGSALVSTQLRLKNADLSALGQGRALYGGAGISVTLSGSGKTPVTLLSSLAGSGTVELKDLSIRGINGSGFADILEAADALGTEITDNAVRDEVLPILTNGALRVGDADFAFSIAGGALRTPPIWMPADGAALTTDISADLAEGSTNVAGVLLYEAGPDALVGSEPVVNFNWSSGRNLIIDTNPLTQFLTQRALEREQARVEAMQAILLEKQRLRREVRYFSALERERQERRRLEEEARTKAEEDARRRAEEALERAEEEARRQAEQEAAARQAEKDAKIEAEAQARAEAELRRLEAETRRKAAEARRNQSEKIENKSSQDGRNTDSAAGIFTPPQLTIESILQNNREF